MPSKQKCIILTLGYLIYLGIIITAINFKPHTTENDLASEEAKVAKCVKTKPCSRTK